MQLVSSTTSTRKRQVENAWWAYEYAVIELGLLGGNLDEQLRRLIETADIWLDITPDDKGGRPTDLAFQVLVERLASLYERQVGRKAGTSYDRVQGPFFRFVRECRDQFALPLERQDSALGKAIYRCLKKRRQR